ncbi:4865_t:CDS:2 [Diversispora eburnea]|uniref:U3 small nucleolar RNA-associated protein 18 homolog n=1 Tax=Diversispora eburnea TaxID=1213867 RepID=A0A9N9F3Q1_9GLOM|nr:4865_t:CDS:2 [Diversispora eburnea]
MARKKNKSSYMREKSLNKKNRKKNTKKNDTKKKAAMDHKVMIESYKYMQKLMKETMEGITNNLKQHRLNLTERLTGSTSGLTSGLSSSSSGLSSGLGSGLATRNYSSLTSGLTSERNSLLSSTRLTSRKDESEKRLENLVFGDGKEKRKEKMSDKKDLEKDIEEKQSNKKVKFSIDLTPDKSISMNETNNDSEDSINVNKESKLLRSTNGAWYDSDDENVNVSLKSKNMLKKLRKTEEEDVISGSQYEMRLRNQYENLHPTPNWATPSSKRKRDDSSSTEKLEQDEISSPEQVVKTPNKKIQIKLLSENPVKIPEEVTPKLLPNDKIGIVRERNANIQGCSQCVIQSATFHPNAQVLMSAGFDKTVRLFQIDGKKNPKIQSVVFNDLPISNASFNPSGSEIIVTGRRKYFYSYNIESGNIERSNGIIGLEINSLENFKISPCGKYICFPSISGNIVLVNYQTKQWMGSFKMNGTVTSIDWSSDGKYLFSIGKDAEVYQWDVGARRCVHKFRDYGGFKPSIISVSKNDNYYAIGSNSGVVNVYDKKCLQYASPRPLNTIMNVTTEIHDMKFNHDTQLLGVSSRSKKGQMKLIHLPSFNVFPNWPIKPIPLNYVQCFDFSTSSSYIAAGNDRGKVLLYRFKHYTKA